MSAPEPRFARIAAMIGDPTRARMLSALMGGSFIAAGELARAAGVTAQTASSHIAKLLESELVVARTQGRHRYFRLADADIAHALEALSLVAERSAAADKWERGAYKPLKAARTCYGHLAGELGVQLFEGLLACGTLLPADGQFALSERGREEMAELGVEVPAAGRRFAYACLDWSERRDHLAGSFAVALLDHALAQGWVRRAGDSRAISLTPSGAKAWSRWLGQRRSMRSVASKPEGDGGAGLRERQAL
ncbi:helix-turn-helix transcriptional regulator [Piscinibacter sp. HJYY11]|uniref:ArsR/SmtB family transcription factor n=1 Tax=Piscinibacter sp. HJYY11 TaxID=2801333 RepID=UPI00191E7252|nr:winged helix-turn-helix domain-containing protein [Piscinibacter sp. HJYY11]MBL0729513.1 winged helix-turn-helix transcriptional regulator [Piscinibacter sp. HJYY11]